MRPAGCVLALAGSALWLFGCVRTGVEGPGGGAITRSESRVAPGQVGLEVVRWQIEDDENRLESALRKHTAATVASMDELALQKNGFVVWPVKRSQLDALLADMGGSYMDVRTWFGQVTSWREIAATQLDSAMLEIDGVARERPSALTRLMVRSWPLPMEDGTRI
ncbi:MAG: hypothetical protein JNK53_08505, partial [Phycisphaerae bacterium]|nr:hypothetical protein [Phycisphaerae bacterium]